MSDHWMGIEIGGTKLQVGIQKKDEAQLVALERTTIDAQLGAAGIRAQLEPMIIDLNQRFPCQRIGIGFGGPVDATKGMTQISHQVEGWNSFPLCEWVTQRTGVPSTIGNDCDVCALAESRLGAGRDVDSMLYVTVGTGIGGGLVINRQLLGRDQPAVAEIGHLRPGLLCESHEITVESWASGWGISKLLQVILRMRFSADSLSNVNDSWTAATVETIKRFSPELAAVASEAESSSPTLDSFDALWQESRDGWIDAKRIGELVVSGNEIAAKSFELSLRVLGWAIAQTLTLTAVQRVVIGGGVASMPEQFFWAPLRKMIDRYLFLPLANAFEIVPAELGDEVVLYGAIELAKQTAGER